MQKIYNIFRGIASAVVVASMATGCFFEKMAMPEDLQSVLIQVNVSADEMQTKATEAPSATEANINSIRIYAFYNGKLSGHFYRGTASSEPIVMDLQLPETGTHSVDFYVVANEASMTLAADSPQLTEAATESQLAQVRFSSFASENGLPMYFEGSVDINVDNVSNDKNTSDGHTDHNYITDGTSLPEIVRVNLSLTRPMAKVSFYAATEDGAAAGMTISDIVLRAAGNKRHSYLLPQTDAVLETIPSKTADADYLASPVLIEGTSESYDNYMHLFTDYLFETPSGLTFDLGFTGGSGSVDVPAVKRNTWYKVYCFFNAEGSLQISYIVADWDEGGDWTFEFDYPTYQSPVLPTGNHTASLPFGNATMYYTGTETGAFSVDFQMTAPAGQTWNPTFIGSATDYTIKVYETSTGVEAKTPVTASDKWYTIKVIPMKSENVGQKISFSIAYTPTWSATPDLLMINGTSGNLAWNAAGSTADVIVIEQTENN